MLQLDDDDDGVVKMSPSNGKTPPPSPFAAGVSNALPTFAVSRNNNKQQRRVSQRPTDHKAYQISHTDPNPEFKPLRNVEPPSLPTIEFAPEHRPFPKAAPALAPTSTTRATDSKYGRPGELNEDDCRPSAGYAGFGWLCGRNVSLSVS